MEFNLGVSKEQYNSLVVDILNTLIRHKDCELKIIKAMLDNDISHINTDTRAKLRDLLNITPTNMNHLIMVLKNKGTLYKKKEGYVITDKVKEVINNKWLTFKFHVN